MRRPILIIAMAISAVGFAQKLDIQETWVSGYARSVLYNDDYTNDTEEDTLSASRLMSGHTLVDLAVNIKPSDKVFVQGMLRVRNDHGGFWGSGVTFDVRNLYLRGLIGNSFRYQVGDINYKLTPYTMFNSDEEFSRNQPKTFDLFQEMNRYDLFYDGNNTWRQQGATGEFGLEFKKYIESMDFTMFMSRLNWAANGGLERLHGGGNVRLKQSDKLDLQFTYVDAFDIPGTAISDVMYRNPVITAGLGLHHIFNDWGLHLDTEFGRSNESLTIGESHVYREDYFYDLTFRAKQLDRDLEITIGQQMVGPQFRSIGAQTKRVDFARYPSAYQRYGNGQNLRAISILDILRDASVYNTTLQVGLMDYDPRYGNASPYGTATPNRRNTSLAVSWAENTGKVDVKAGVTMGEEVFGEGTPALRVFNTVDVNATLNVDKLISYDKDIELQLGLWNENTDRSGREDFEDISFSNNSFSAGLSVEFAEDFHFISGLRMIRSEGNEFAAMKDVVGEIITFQPIDYDSQQHLTALGLRYDFSENALINFQYTAFSLEDDLDRSEDYSLSNFSIIYRMNF